MLDFLFYPKSVAVIGASRTTGKVGHEVLSNLVGGGFAGRIVPVNPAADKVMGLPCYHTIADYGSPVDLTIIALPAPAVVDAVRSSIGAGTKAIIVLTAGFGETGSRGTLLQSEIAQYCSAARVRLLGPNCLGLINTSHHLNVSFSRSMPQAGGVSVISQSGALCTAVLDWAQARGLGLCKVISIGNKADLDEKDFLKVLAADEQTKVVVGYLESITCGEEFMRAARAVTSSKPFILLRAGVTKAGMWAACAHTGNLGGSDTTYAAAFKRAGIIRAESFDALCDYTLAFSRQPLPRGDRVAIITNAGGPAVMAVDAVERSALQLARLDGPAVEKLKGELPPSAGIGNPVDVLGDADPRRYAAAVSASQQTESVDATLVILTPHAMTQPSETIRAVAAQTNGDKPLLLVFLGEPNGASSQSQNLPVYSSPERGVAALHAMYEYHLWRHRPEYAITRFPVNRRRVERIILRHVRTNSVRIDEVETKEILRAYDLSVPDGAMASSPQEAAEIAERVGFPVAMKVVSAAIVHKSDVGGVKLNIASAEDVRDTFDLLTLRVARRAPDIDVEGVYVEKMCGHGLQVVLGVTCDPRFGPLLVFGLGGTFVDRLKDVCRHLAPITADEAMQMLSETRSYGLLQSSLGPGNVDVAAIIGGLQRISQLATDFPQVKELSIDPYLVGPVGTEAMVVDARMTLFSAGHER